MTYCPEHQIVLPLQIGDHATFEQFYVKKENALLVELLRKPQNYDPILIVGPTKSGCTHLLQSSCAAFQSMSTMYFSMKSQLHINDFAIDMLANIHLVCIDDLDCVVGNITWQEHLFSIINTCQRNKIRLILSAHKSIETLALWADLTTRLQAFLKFKLWPLSGDEINIAMRRFFDTHSLNVHDGVLEYCFTHVSREIGSLKPLLMRFYHYCICYQCKMTVHEFKRFLSSTS